MANIKEIGGKLAIPIVAVGIAAGGIGYAIHETGQSNNKAVTTLSEQLAKGAPSTTEAAGRPNSPTNTIIDKTPASAEVSRAEQIATWPPENGQFHNIEIDGTQAGSYVEAEIWFKGLNGEIWINMSGRRAQFNDCAGTAFQWINGDPRTIETEIKQAKARRESEDIKVTEMSLDEFMEMYPGRVDLLSGDGTTR